VRLEKVTHGHGLKAKVMFGLMRVFTGFRAPDVVRTLFYRPEFFGAHHNRWTQSAMRGPGEWEIWERELFAAFVSRKNRCLF
jgi:hypothetical protein